MRLVLPALPLLCCLALAPTAARADAVGVWLNQDEDAHIEIERCGARLCGTIVWIAEPLDETGTPRTDLENPDPALRDRAIVGLRILDGFPIAADDAGKWTGGTVYDPKSGKTYRGYMVLQDDGRLKLRGYVGIPLFGRTVRWTRIRPAAE